MSRFGIAMLASCLAFASAACGASMYRYDAGRFRPIQGAAGQPHAVMVGVVNAFVVPEPTPGAAPTSRENEARAAESFQELRASVSEHATRAGFLDGNRRLAPAPTNAAELDALLTSAAQSGSTEVALVRFVDFASQEFCFSSPAGLVLGILPALILYSIPIGRHGAMAAIEVVAVDPRSREVLFRTGQLGTFRDRASAWTCGKTAVGHDVLGQAVESAFQGLAQARVAGFPGRRRVADLAHAVLSPASVYVAGNRVFGPGFSAPFDPTWSLLEDSPRQPAGGARSWFSIATPEGITISMMTDASVTVIANDPSYTDTVREGLRLFAPIRSESRATAGSLAGVEFAAGEGDNATLQRVVTADGLGIVLACAGSERALTASAGACRRFFDGFQWNFSNRDHTSSGLPMEMRR